MKQIIIEFNQQSTSTSTLDAIINDIGTKFNIIDDSKDKFTNLRFVTIDAELVQFNVDSLGIELRQITKPHIFVSIFKKYIYQVDLEM